MLVTLSESEIISTLLALAFLLASAFIVGTIFEKLKAPRVVGEITGGMIWGGTLLYHFFQTRCQVFLWHTMRKERS